MQRTENYEHVWAMKFISKNRMGREPGDYRGRQRARDGIHPGQSLNLS